MVVMISASAVRIRDKFDILSTPFYVQDNAKKHHIEQHESTMWFGKWNQMKSKNICKANLQMFVMH